MSEPLRVLLVDDHDGIRAALSALLRASDFEIAGEAADGDTALTEAACLRPDVVLLDVSMPGRGGMEALPGLRANLPGAVVIVLTSHANPLYRNEAFRLGADAFVLKQQASFELIPAIHDALSARNTRRRREA